MDELQCHMWSSGGSEEAQCGPPGGWVDSARLTLGMGWEGREGEERGDREIPCNTSSGSSVVENGPGEGKDGGRGYSKIPSFTRPGAAPHRDAAEQKFGLNIVTKGYKSCFVNAQRKVSLQFVPGDHHSAVRGAD